jgi:acetate kinase
MSRALGADEHTDMTGAILTLNAGSSSLKFALFDSAAPAMALLSGEVSDLKTAPHMVAHDREGNSLIDRNWQSGSDGSFAVILAELLEFIDAHPGHDGLAAVGHRVVHGGSDHIAPERVTPALLQSLTTLIALDPIHMPHNIAPIRAIALARPKLPQIACFDTAFHRTLPPVAQRFALPRAITDAGVRRYGFHGLSYEYIAGRLREEAPALARGRVVVAHLGAGASLCALLNGASIATTFGFSVLDGLVMATRCGSLDPGVILYLGRQGQSFADIEDMLYNRSGLLGVSGISEDIRVLLTSTDSHARDAIELFTYRLAIEIAGMAAALGGLDGIVFTAGIGSHSPEIRSAVCERLAWLGVRLDLAANHTSESCISAADSDVEVRVMATDEELMIADHVRNQLLSSEITGKNAAARGLHHLKINA